MKGQTSFEYVILVGAILVLVVPLFYYVSYESSTNLRINQANDAVKSIARTADTIYAFGPGAKNYVWVTIPSGINNVTILDNEIIMTLTQYGGKTDLVAYTRANITGNIPSSQGTYKIPIEMLDSDEVKIG